MELRMRRLGVLVVTSVCLGALGACASSASTMPGLSASPTATAAPVATATPRPTGVVETSDPTLGITFDTAPQLSGEEAEVYNWVAVYEKEFWRTLRTNTVAPAMTLLTSPELRASLESMAKSNTTDGSVVTGSVHVRIGTVAVQGGTATASVCRDFSGMTVVEGGRTLTAQETGAAAPQRRDMTLVSVPAEHRWIVQTSTAAGAC